MIKFKNSYTVKGKSEQEGGLWIGAGQVNRSTELVL
jgi:hypothetical protein